jgi:protein arginine kinase activator
MPVCDCCGKRQAAFHISIERRKTVTRQRLCRPCAEEMGVYAGPSRLPPSVPYLCEPLLVGEDEETERVCPECGATLSAVAASGKVGCPTCYETFEVDLTAILRKTRERAYRGRLPRRLARYRKLLMEGSSLRMELETALQVENYEEAARLRDALNSIDLEE